MIDIDNLPTVGGIKVIPIEEVVAEVGCETLPHACKLSVKLVRTWLNIHNFGSIAFQKEDEPFFYSMVIAEAKENHHVGIAYQNLS